MKSTSKLGNSKNAKPKGAMDTSKHDFQGASSNSAPNSSNKLDQPDDTGLFSFGAGVSGSVDVPVEPEMDMSLNGLLEMDMETTDSNSQLAGGAASSAVSTDNASATVSGNSPSSVVATVNSSSSHSNLTIDTDQSSSAEREYSVYVESQDKPSANGTPPPVPATPKEGNCRLTEDGIYFIVAACLIVLTTAVVGSLCLVYVFRKEKRKYKRKKAEEFL